MLINLIDLLIHKSYNIIIQNYKKLLKFKKKSDLLNLIICLNYSP